MIETDFENLRGRGVAGDVPAELPIGLVGTDHHRERVPANDRRQAGLDRDVAGVGLLLLKRNRIAIGRKRRRVRQNAELLRAPIERSQDVTHALGTGAVVERSKRGEPIGGFDRILIGVDDLAWRIDVCSHASGSEKARTW
ncbi:ribosomal protein S19E (S16A) [Bradyrhizobium ottawaense]